MMRAILGVLVGYVVWSLMWLGGNAGLGVYHNEELEAFERGEPITSLAFLLLALVLSAICSFFAGLTTALVARERSGIAVLTMALLLLATGIAVQAGSWSQMPVWYHLIFLALIVPASLFGGRGKRR